MEEKMILIPYEEYLELQESSEKKENVLSEEGMKELFSGIKADRGGRMRDDRLLIFLNKDKLVDLFERTDMLETKDTKALVSYIDDKSAISFIVENKGHVDHETI